MGNIEEDNLLESQYIKKQEVQKKGEVTRVYLLSPNVTHLARKSVLVEKEKQLDDIKEGIYSIVENLAEIDKALQSMDDIDKKQIDFFKDEDNLSEIIEKFHAFFPDLNIPEKLNSDKLKAELAKTPQSAPDILYEVSILIDELYLLDNLIKRAEASLPYYAQIYYDTMGDHGDHSITIPVALTPEKPDQARWTLDAKKMMSTLHNIIASDIKYDLNGYNCSTAVGEIISAGIPDEKQKRDFQVLLSSKYLPATPQGALRATEHLASELQSKRIETLPKPSTKSENLFAQSITMVVNDLAKQIRETTVVITKSDFMKEKEKSKILKAKNIEDLIEHIKWVRENENKIPIIDDKLNMQIEKIKVSHEKRLSKLSGKPKSKKDIESQAFLDNYHKLQLTNEQTLKYATNKQEKLRAKRMTERKDRKEKERKTFIKLVNKFEKNPTDNLRQQIQLMIEQNLHLKEIKLNPQTAKLLNYKTDKKEKKRQSLILSSNRKDQENSMQSGKTQPKEDLSINTSRAVAKKRPE